MGEENNKVLESENEALDAGLEFFKRLHAKSETELTQSKVRIEALERVAEVAKRFYNATTLLPGDEIQGCREALEIALKKLEEV